MLPAGFVGESLPPSKEGARVGGEAGRVWCAVEVAAVLWWVHRLGASAEVTVRREARSPEWG